MTQECALGGGAMPIIDVSLRNFPQSFGDVVAVDSIDLGTIFAVGGCSKTNLAGFAGWQPTWSESCGLASEPLCTGFFSTLLAVNDDLTHRWQPGDRPLAGRPRGAAVALPSAG